MNFLLVFSLLSMVLSAQAATKQEQLKVAMAQINVTVGDFNGTIKKVMEAYRKAEAEGADILITPEGILPGYPAWDMVDQDHFIQRADQAVEILRQMTMGKKTALLLGHITFNPEDRGRKLHNVASFYSDGKLLLRQVKSLLPTYDVFDDGRYFEPGRTTKLLNFRGFKLAIRVCEDWWFGDKHGTRTIYRKDPTKFFEGKGVDLAISLSVSPYYDGKIPLRENVHGERARALDAPFILVNTVGGIDQLQMDGSSFVLNRDGTNAGRLAHFAEDFGIVTIDRSRNVAPLFKEERHRQPALPGSMELILEALKQGYRDYMTRIGQQKVVFGLSGGLDSGATAAVSVETLGPKNVYVVLMPSEFSSEGSVKDALESAKNLGIPSENVFIIPIQEAFEIQKKVFEREFKKKGIDINQHPDFVPFENLQARNRMIIEYFISNMFPGMIKVNTSNKSELSMGYSTFYADSTGAFSLFGDLYKTEVRALSRYLNERSGKALVPWNTINKPPSAELRKGQITANEIPPYEILDPLLMDLIENNMGPEELKAKYTSALAGVDGWGPDWVDRVLRRFSFAEWKRDQAPFTLKVHRKAFGIGRRVPVSGVKFQQVMPAGSCRWLF